MRIEVHSKQKIAQILPQARRPGKVMKKCIVMPKAV